MIEENVLEYESVKNALKSIALAKGGSRSDGTAWNYKSFLGQYLEFVNSQVGLEPTLTPDDLLEEARVDRARTQERIVNFFQWLQGNEIPGYRPWTVKGKSHKIRYNSARQRAYSTVRGFYTNNEITFPKNFRAPPSREPDAIQQDETVPFFRIDEEKGTLYFDRSLMKHFLANLKLRDQAIALSLLSTSQDTGDLFSLSVGWARRQRNRERFYWNGNRNKTGQPFKTFFTKEATEYVRRYLGQERREASDDDPLFVTVGNSGLTSMRPKNLGDIYREVAKKMDLHDGGKYQNPLRPKRLRHVFRTACSTVYMDEGYMNVFMGHRTSVSGRYLEKPTQVLELEYCKVEPTLTVFEASESSSISEVRTELSERKAELLDLRDRNIELRRQIQDLREEHLEFKRSVEKRLEQILEKMRGAVEESPS